MLYTYNIRYTFYLCLVCLHVSSVLGCMTFLSIMNNNIAGHAAKGLSLTAYFPRV